MKLKKFKFKKVISTNNTAIRIIKNSNYKSGMVISDKQIRGKGQYGKKWISYKGNLFVSFFYELKNINLILDKKFLIVGIGINLVKNPRLINYPTTNLLELINKSVSKIKLENELKQLFEKNLTRLYKINFKINKV